MRKRNSLSYLIFICILAVFCLSGCAATKIYSINMAYDAQKAAVSAYLKPDTKALQSIIAVAEFMDVRKVDDTLVIGHVIEKDGMKVPVLPKYTKPTEAVAQGIRHYLRKAGYNVSGVIGPWDLKAESIPQIANSKILIGGAIESMSIDCRKAFPTNAYKTKMKLRLYLADIINKKILYQETIEATTELDYVSFSEERLGKQASVALGDAIEKMFEKREMARKILESLSL